NPYFYNAIHTNNNNERDYAFHVREDLEVTAKIKKIETDGVLLELHATFHIDERCKANFEVQE
ncbi:13537_t:CDS:2, partial [Entrophospora sp. SA101]